jgi:uncharacterized membrane protein (DUF4010 family)
VLVVTAFLNAAVALALVPLLAPVAVLGGVLVVLMRRKGDNTADTTAQGMSPLGLVSAIQMVVVFQVAKIAIRFAHEWWGTTGIFASAAFLGLADMDALTFSTSRSEVAAVPATAAAVIATGMISNNAMKAFIAFIVGKAEVRSRAAIALVLMAATGGVMILLFN